MAIQSSFEGTSTIGTTDWSVSSGATPASLTAQGVYQVFLDLNNLAAGDQFQIALYEKAVAAGTQRLVETWYFTGAQAKPLWVSPSLILMYGWDIRLKKLTGTDRSITWSIRRVA